MVWPYLVELHNVAGSILLVAAASSELSSVSWEQVKSKDVPCSDGWYNAFVVVVNKYI